MSDDRAAFREQMDEIIGGMEIYVTFARDRFALRYGPIDVEEVEDLIDWGEREKVPFLITAQGGALIDRALAASLFGETRAERAELKDKPRREVAAHVNAIRVMGDNVAHLLMSGRHDGVRLEALRDAFKPIDALADKIERDAPMPAESENAKAIERLLDERNAAMNGFFGDPWRDGLRVERIAEIDGQLRGRGYKGELAPVFDNDEDCAGRADVARPHPINLRDDNCELPKPPPEPQPEKALVKAARRFYRESIRQALARDFGHEGSEFLERASELRSALLSVGCLPVDVDLAQERTP